MKLDIEQVKKVAKLANLTLTSGEEEKFSSQLSKILGYIEELNSVDTANVEPTFNVGDRDNILREDVSETGLSQDEALFNAPVKKDAVPAGRQGFFVTKGVFNDE